MLATRLPGSSNCAVNWIVVPVGCASTGAAPEAATTVAATTPSHSPHLRRMSTPPTAQPRPRLRVCPKCPGRLKGRWPALSSTRQHRSRACFPSAGGDGPSAALDTRLVPVEEALVTASTPIADHGLIGDLQTSALITTE